MSVYKNFIQNKKKRNDFPLHFCKTQKEAKMTYEQAVQKATKQLLTKKAKLIAEIGELEAKLLAKKAQLAELEKENAIEEFAQKILEQEQKRKEKKIEQAQKLLEQQGLL